MSNKKKDYYTICRTTRSYNFYKYMDPQWLEEFIAKDIIKATELSTVNDPLEWRPAFNNQQEAHAWDTQPPHPVHVLCLSSKISSSAMWGHYALAHRGISLALNIPLNFHEDTFNTTHNLHTNARSYPIGQLGKGCPFLMKVTYSPTRATHTPANPISTTYRIISEKGPDWAAESEYRIHISDRNLRHKPDGTPIYTGLRKYLTGIILGVKCSPETEQHIRTILQKHNRNIPVVRATLHLTEHRIIAPPYQDTDTAELDSWTIDNHLPPQLTTANPQAN